MPDVIDLAIRRNGAEVAAIGHQLLQHRTKRLRQTNHFPSGVIDGFALRHHTLAAFGFVGVVEVDCQFTDHTEHFIEPRRAIAIGTFNEIVQAREIDIHRRSLLRRGFAGANFRRVIRLDCLPKALGHLAG